MQRGKKSYILCSCTHCMYMHVYSLHVCVQTEIYFDIQYVVA